MGGEVTHAPHIEEWVEPSMVAPALLLGVLDIPDGQYCRFQISMAHGGLGLK